MVDEGSPGAPVDDWIQNAERATPGSCRDREGLSGVPGVSNDGSIRETWNLFEDTVFGHIQVELDGVVVRAQVAFAAEERVRDLQLTGSFTPS